VRKIVGPESTDVVDRAGAEGDELVEEAADAEVANGIFCVGNTRGSEGVAVVSRVEKVG